MRYSLLLLLLLLISTQQTPQSLAEDNFYTSPTGNDANSGSIDSPWGSITHGITQVKPGDTLYIREGVYHEKLRLDASGTSQNYICIRNYPGETPVIDGTDSDGNGLVASASYFKLVGLEFRSWDENALWIESSHHFELINITVHEVEYGIGVADGSHDFLLKNCNIFDFVLYGFDASPVTDSSCYNALIQDCAAYHGSDSDQNVDGFAVGHGTQSGFTFVNCTTYDVYDGFDISSHDTMLIGCLSWGCWNTGYKLWGNNITLVNSIDSGSNNNLELDWSGTPKTVNVIHSDFIDSKTFGIWVENRLDKIKLYNSVVAGGENIALCFENGNSDSYTGDYNLIHSQNQDRIISIAYEQEYSLADISQGKWSQDTGQDSHSLFSPDTMDIFMDLENMNLYPAPSSLLLDRGDPSKSIPYDYTYNTRGDLPDIGAFEYSETANTSIKPVFKISETNTVTQQKNMDHGVEPTNSYTTYLYAALVIIILLILYYVRWKILYKS